jgi:hypothetical protein
MSIQGLAKASELEKYWSSDLLTSKSERLEITSEERKRVEVACENYPYEEQVILYGQFKYHLDGRRGYEPTANGKYLYRPESGLFFVQIRQSNVEENRVIEEINSAIGETAAITRVKAYSRQSLLNFLENAEQIFNLQIKGPEGETSLRDLLRDEEDGFGFHQLEDDLEDYLILSAKASFKKPDTDERRVVEYNRGKFTIPISYNEEDYLLDGTSEYIVQLLERDIINNISH